MRKWIVGLMAMVLCVALCGCTFKKTDTIDKTTTTRPTKPTVTEEIDPLAEVKGKIEAGEFRAAYNLLKENDSEEAAALLQRFVFLPSRITEGGNEIRYTYEDGKLVNKYVATAGEYWMNTDYTCTADGNLLTADVEDSGFYNYKITYTYDEQGRMLAKDSIQVTNYDSQTWTKETYTYDDQGRCVLTETITSEGARTKSTYTYNVYGDVIKEVIDTSDGEYTEITYTYNRDDDGMVQKKAMGSSNGDWAQWLYTYKDGLLATMTSTAHYAELDVTEESVEEYVYDVDGNLLIKQGEYSEGIYSGIETGYSYVLHYYPNGAPLWVENFEDTMYGE